MIKRLSPGEIWEVYTDILKHGLQGLKSLEMKQIEQVREYAESKHFNNLKVCESLLIGSVNLPENYPPEYRGGREFEYWQSRLNGYEEPERVLDIISEYKNLNPSDMDKIPNDNEKRKKMLRLFWLEYTIVQIDQPHPTLADWENRKIDFFENRIAQIKDTLTLKHRISIEIDRIKYISGCYTNGLSMYGEKKLCEFYLELLEQKYKEAEALEVVNDKTQKGDPPIKYTAKHHVLAYIFECNAKGERYPLGNKKKLERIGNERMEAGKGNRFYKVFNDFIDKDLNVENNLLEIGGEHWRKAVIELSKTPELVEKYLQNKQL